MNKELGGTFDNPSPFGRSDFTTSRDGRIVPEFSIPRQQREKPKPIIDRHYPELIDTPTVVSEVKNNETTLLIRDFDLILQIFL